MSSLNEGRSSFFLSLHEADEFLEVPSSSSSHSLITDQEAGQEPNLSQTLTSAMLTLTEMHPRKNATIYSLQGHTDEAIN